MSDKGDIRIMVEFVIKPADQVDRDNVYDGGVYLANDLLEYFEGDERLKVQKLEMEFETPRGHRIPYVPNKRAESRILALLPLDKRGNK